MCSSPLLTRRLVPRQCAMLILLMMMIGEKSQSVQLHRESKVEISIFAEVNTTKNLTPSPREPHHLLLCLF